MNVVELMVKCLRLLLLRGEKQVLYSNKIAVVC